MLLGVDSFPSTAELCEGDVGLDPGPWEALMESRLSASLFSNVPKSVRPLSSSVSRPRSRECQLCHDSYNSMWVVSDVPDSLSKLSILPSRFSSPSIYFALPIGSAEPSTNGLTGILTPSEDSSSFPLV